MDDRLTLRPDLLLARVDDQVVAYDAPNRTSHVLNITAAAFLGECDGESSLDDIAVRLAASFGADPGPVLDNLHTLVPDLAAASLLGREPSEVPEIARTERLPRRSTLEALHHRRTDERRWAWRSETLGALGFRFDLRTDDPDLATYLPSVLAPLTFEGDAQHHYLVTTRASAGDETPEAPSRVDLTLDGHSIRRRGTAASIASHLLWHINRLSVAATPDRVILHAAGATSYQGTAILPATSGSGKSTLVAALVQHGFSYLSDEALAVVPGTTIVEPYPKAITLDRASWEVHASLRPTRVGTEAFETSSWQIPATDVRPDSIGGKAAVDVIVFPTYEAGSGTVLTPLEPVDTLVELLTDCFDFFSLGQTGLDTLAGLAQSVPAYRLVSSDLGEAVETIDGLLADTTRQPAK